MRLRADNYKYRFKSLDPEFGIIKEEVIIFILFAQFLNTLELSLIRALVFCFVIFVQKDEIVNY